MIFFTGDCNLTDWDFNFGFGIGSRISQGFNPFARCKRNASDIWVGNFEGVTSDVTDKIAMSARVFRVDPKALEGLPHLDFYGFANNHAMQHGEAAYIQTVTTLTRIGSHVFGSKEQKSIFTEHQGRKVTMTGVSMRVDEFTDNPCYWHNPEYKEIEDVVQGLPVDAYKVLFIHWGNEYINRPSSQQKKFAHWLVDVGFDLIIGMHPHVLQGYEDYHGKRIYYSLGNFVFDMAWEPCRYGAIVGVDIGNREPIFNNNYVYIDGTCAPYVIPEGDVPVNYRFEYLNQQLKKEENSEEYYNEINRLYRSYSWANRKRVLKNVLFHPRFGVSVVKDFVRRRIVQ